LCDLESRRGRRRQACKVNGGERCSERLRHFVLLHAASLFYTSAA
jgi:hypothetical protein